MKRATKSLFRPWKYPENISMLIINVQKGFIPWLVELLIPSLLPYRGQRTGTQSCTLKLCPQLPSSSSAQDRAQGGHCCHGVEHLISWGTASLKPPQTSSFSPIKWWKHCHKIYLKVHVNVFLSTLRTSQAFQFSSQTFSNSGDKILCYQDLGKIWTQTCSDLKMFPLKYKKCYSLST